MGRGLPGSREEEARERWAEVTAVVQFCQNCAHFAGGRCALTGWQVFPTRPACAGFEARDAQPQRRQVAPLTSTLPAPQPRFQRLISLCRRRPVRRKPDYFAYSVNVPIDAVRAWAGGGEPPRKLIATFDGRKLVLEPLGEEGLRDAREGGERDG